MFEVIHEACVWLQAQPWSIDVRESDWLFPTIETIHVLALVIVIGSIYAVDLRLLGLSAKSKPFSSVARDMLPWTWSAFAVASLAGLAMFASKAVTYAANIPFRLKMLFLLLAGINMMVFQLVGLRHLERWDSGRPSRAARMAGGASLLLWTAVVASGRWIGFTT